MRRRILLGFVIVATTGLAALASFSAPSPRQSLGADIDRLTAAALSDLIQWRRHLHQNPELSNREVETAKYVAAQLRGLGLEPRTGVARHGVVAAQARRSELRRPPR